MVYVEMLLITLVTVYVIDLSGFTDAWTSTVSGWLTHGKRKEPFTFKPFTCSLCMSLWLNLIWVIVTSNFAFFPVAFCFLMSFLAPTFNDMLVNVQDALSFINNKINSIFQ